ncbi:MAG: ATP-binding cassette domain-containing protein [Pseudomonadales bacterium]|nr:ATP-binding cassette domain-containing protein [Pseudomonadales bacterium]MDG1441287.1 ATP-binding cassette domain-containing protein [Pseudomonadales bacterium]
MTKPAALNVYKISKHYQDGSRRIDVIADLSFNVAAGESLSIMGPSGSGKSTLLNLLAGLLELDEGDITLALKDQSFSYRAANERSRTALRRQSIGYVYQFFNLVPTLTVLENVRLPARLNHRRDLERHASTLLGEFGLADRLNDFPERLSGGEQQRVAVARALLLKPPLLLADEPTGNLDAENSKHVAELLFSSCREQNISLVLATHSNEVAAMADTRLQLDRPSPS